MRLASPHCGSPLIVSRFRSFVIGLVLLTLNIGTPQLVRGADPLDDYRLAVGLYNKGRWSLAADSFRKFIKDHPQDDHTPRARYYLGLTLVNVGDYRQSRDTLRAFARDFPKSEEAVQARFWIGECSYLLEDFPAAEAELSAFIKAAPRDRLLEQALPRLGDVELRLNKPQQAIQTFQQSLKVHPKGALAEDAKFGLAKAYEAAKQYPAAVKLYEELADNRKGAHAAESRLNLGARAFEDGNYRKAAEAYARVEQDFPNSRQVPLARLNLGYAYYQLEQYEQAISQFELAGKTEKYAADAALWKGLSLKAADRLPEAIATFQQAYKKYQDRPEAETVLFQWGETLLRAGKSNEAITRYLELVSRWPKSELASEALHAACNAAVSSEDWDAADKLLARFDREYPGNRLRYRQEVLKARVRLGRNDPKQAAEMLNGILQQSDIASTQMQARYYQGLALQKLGNHPQVLEVTAPLASQVDKDPQLQEFGGVHVLRGVSLLALVKATPAHQKQERHNYCLAAIDETQSYLSKFPKGDVADQAYAVRILAEAIAGNKPGAQADLQTFAKTFPDSPEREKTLFELGEIAFANEDWAWAGQVFTELVAAAPKGKYHDRALSELGWTAYKQQKFDDAAASFARLLKEHPKSPLAPETTFMQGTSLQDAGKLDAALAVFTAGFDKYGASEQAYLCGLQAARTLEKLNRVPDADRMYEKLAARFPKRDKTDLLLNEWATVNYTAERFERADEVFRRITKEFPNSSVADNARLSLAESDLIAGKLEAARAEFASLATGDGSDEQVQQRSLYQILRIDLERKDWDALRKTGADSLKRFPEGKYRWDAEFSVAEADFQQEKYPAARDRLLRLVEHKQTPEVAAAPWFPRLWLLLVETEFRLKNYEAVSTLVADIRKSDPEFPILYQLDEIRGRSLKAQAMFPEARAAFEQALADERGKLTETAAKCQFHIAETYLLEKNYRQALLEYLKVDIMYKYPEWQAPALFQAAGCHEALEEWPDAVKTYENMLQMYPTSEFAAQAKQRLEAARKKAGG